MEKIMDINKENAMKLWHTQFGKSQKVKDFAGREIMKSAFDDRKSKYGWNIDHIMPQSQGGKSTMSNLICCSILTNDEKQDSFPCFTANEKSFEIKRVQNHYEIFEINPQNQCDDESVNFFSAAEGLQYLNGLIDSGINLFYSSVSISINLLEPDLLNVFYEFIKKLFTDSVDDELEYIFGNIHGIPNINLSDFDKMFILNRNCKNQEQVQNMLDTCILLNTYLNSFLGQYLDHYSIYLATKEVSYEFSSKDTKDVLKNLDLFGLSKSEYFVVDETTKQNTDLKNRQLEKTNISLVKSAYIYNYVYKQLENDLHTLQDNKQN